MIPLTETLQGYKHQQRKKLLFKPQDNTGKEVDGYTSAMERLETKIRRMLSSH